MSQNPSDTRPNDTASGESDISHGKPASKRRVDTKTRDQSDPRLPAGLYIVATPIGNLQDITFRAVDTLKRADLIACEDTRTTRRLLTHYGISTATMPYHDHSDQARREALLTRIRDGEAVALVSDAGTPLISDPGYRLVVDARAEGVPVIPIPGVSSVVTALSAGGLATDRFFFAGFPPHKSKARRDLFMECAAIPGTLIFLESPRRLTGALADMAEILGSRQAVVARELTKLYEEFRAGELAELAAHYAEAGAPKGEIVVLVGPNNAGPQEIDPASLDRILRAALDRGEGVKDLATTVADQTGQKRRAVYQRALTLKQKKDE